MISFRTSLARILCNSLVSLIYRLSLKKNNNNEMSLESLKRLLQKLRRKFPQFRL